MKQSSVTNYNTEEFFYDVVVVGGGGAGLRAAMGIAASGEASVCCVSKLFPLRSNTVAAQGGIAAALGNVEEDSWMWHVHDTVHGADGLGDYSAIEYMCRSAEGCVMELEKMGVPFSRLKNGNIFQRKFGGMKRHDAIGGDAYRTCAAADKTGHAILHTLYQQCLKNDVHFLSEVFVIDLIRDSSGEVVGVISWSIAKGAFFVISAKVVILATGGYTRIYKSCTASYSCTGDAFAMVLRAGLAVKDPEFIQFHPTGLYGVGCLISEAVRSEGGFLVNSENERFMERYSPESKDLATRDLISRCIMKEIEMGRGCGDERDHVFLKADHLDMKVVDSRLPGVKDIVKTFMGKGLEHGPIPVFPTSHYSMGGIPTNISAEVLDGNNVLVPGLMSIGESACISVHGANRLGSNSLLELVVFGAVAADRAVRLAKSFGQKNKKIQKSMYEKHIDRVNNLIFSIGNSSVAEIRSSMRLAMQNGCGIIRNKSSLLACSEELCRLENCYKKDLFISDKGLIWNESIVEALELGNMLTSSIVVIKSALMREESRGSHFREDFPGKNDEVFHRHTIASLDNGSVAVGYAQVDSPPAHLLD